MGLWKRFTSAVKRFFSGGGGGGGYSSSRRVYNNRDSRRVTSSNTSARRAYINAYKGERDDLNRGSSISDAWEKTRKAFKASSSKATPDPKETLRQSARENRKKETKDWYKATNQKYNVSGAKDKAEELKRRQAVKSRAFDASTAVKEEKHELKYHPYAYSGARRAARGLSLTGELLEKKGTKGEAKKAQQYFEKNQNKIAGGIGEAAGTMAAFALTANPSKVAVKKVLPKAVRVSAEKGGEKLAARLAEKKLIRKAAEKEVKNAVKKGLTKEVTKEAIDKVAKQKAKETVANLGEDFAQNITTGAINDISRASANHKVGSKGWRRELAASGAMNFGLGGAATVGLPALGKGVKRALGGVSEGAEDALKGLSKNSDVKVSLNRKRKTDVRLAKAKEPTVKVELNRKRKTDVRLPYEGRDGQTFMFTRQGFDGTPAERFAVTAKNASEAVDKAVYSNPSKVIHLEGRIKPRAETKAATEFATSKEAIDELNSWRGETHLGSYGTITKNEDGTYNLFVNGYGDKTLTEREALDYIDDAVKRINADEERIRVTRTSPLTEAENARIKEIDDKIARLEAEGKADVEKHGAKGKYKGIEGYWDRQAERGRKITELTNEKTRIEIKEPETARISDWRDSLVDANSVDEFIEANLNNKGFVEYGRSKDTSINDIRNLWYETRMKQNPMEAHEIGIEEANNIVRETLPENVRSGWFRNADSEYKPHAMYYLSGNGEARNAGLNIGYWNYKNASPNNTLSFDEWLVTPQKMYRGSHGQAAIDDDIFSAFTPDRSIAEKFATGKNAQIDEITVRPIDTLGSYQTTSEQEFLVPQDVINAAKQEPDEAAENIKVSLNRKRKTDVRLPNEKPAPKANDSFPYEGTPEAEALVRGQQSAPLSVDEMAGVDETMPSTNPRQTEANETLDTLEHKVAQIAEEPPKEADDSLKINAGEEATVGGRPSGVRQVRSAYEYNNGEPIEDGILTSWNEAWQASKEYSESHARGNKSRMSKVAVSELNAMDSDAERELRQRLADSGELNYDAISTPELYDKIAKQMRDDPDRWVKDMIDINQGGALDFRSTPEWQARVQYIMGTVDPSADAASEIAYTEAFKLAQNISSKGGQTLNLRRNFVHLTPMGKRDAILDDFINILQRSKGFQKNHPQMRTLGHFDKRNYIRNVLMEDDAIRDGVEKLVNADDPNAVGDAFTELMYNVNKKNPKSGFDVLQELRYLNMLGNIKTHGRNVFGSAFFIPIREASNSIRSLIEKPIEKWASQYGKFDVTKHGAVWQRATPEAKNAANEAFEALKNDVLGSAKYETVSYKGRGKTAVGKAVDALSDFNSTLLTKEDDAFRTRAFKNSYAKSYSRYQRDDKPITDKIKRKIEQEAIRESQVATFNEYNSFASFLNNITRKATDAEASTGARWGGRALNAVMPFTKVPANLMNQSLNYSPLGLARGMANIKTAAKTGDSAALNTAIDQLASGMTGSAVFGLGMLLGNTTDMFTTNAGKNDPAAKFKKDRGMQNYSVTFKDPETGQGYSFTLDWLVPTSATFFSGVEMANQLKKGDFNVLDIGGDWSSVVSRLAEPVMETSMLSGLRGMLETMRSGSNADDDKGAISILLRETVQSYMNSLVPTLAGQISRTAYKSDMQIVGDTDWEYWRNQMKSKAGLANTNILGEALGADTDAYGNVKGEKKNSADYAKSALKNFLSPANIQKVDFSKVDDEKLRVYEEAVKNGADPEEMAYLFPKKQYKKQFKVAGEEVKMSNKDVSTYNQAKTKGGEEGMRYILENIMFNRQTVGADGKKVPADSAYTKEQKQALMNEFKGKSMREVEEWLYSQPEFKNATDAEKKKAINGLWTLDSAFNSKANASRRVGEQAVYKAQGKDVNEYNFKNEVSEKKREAIEPLVAAGVVSYEEAVDFARNAGKTYYYEDEDGGHSATYYNKKEMIQYLIDKGYSYEKAEALFNSFKASNAKPYSGNNLSSGKGRRGRRGYRRRGGGGGSSKTVKTSVPIKASDYKASKGTYKDMASALKTRSTSKRKASTKSTAVPKITPPKVKFKKYEV